MNIQSTQVGCLLLLCSLLSGCSRNVTWEEEVLLNTGDRIWVKRQLEYPRQGDAGNPLDVKYRPTDRTVIEFRWKGVKYHYEGGGGFRVLAISPSGVPVLVRPADAGLWNVMNKYGCTVPFYVQFVPDGSGSRWSWPPAIEPWLYNLPTNLLTAVGEMDKMRPRYTHEEKPNLLDPQLRHSQLIDPTYTGDLCSRGSGVAHEQETARR